MKLHIVTANSRSQYLEEIYRSIPLNDDIFWHIAKSKYTPSLEISFLYDKRVKIYEVDCLDTDPTAKINHALDTIKEGYFMVLDDDTIFLKTAYSVYEKYRQNGFEGMIIGNQTFCDEPFVFKRSYQVSTDPGSASIDTGMVICHSSVLGHLRWKSEKYYGDDVRFWSACYAHFGKKNTQITKEIISFYNFFEPKIKVRKRLGSLLIKLDINNPLLVMGYQYLSLGRRYIRRITNQKTRNNFPQRDFINIFE